MRNGKRTLIVLFGVFAAAGRLEAADLVANNLFLAQGGSGNLAVSGSIGGGEQAFGVTLVVEIVPLAVTAGSVTFTVASDIAQAGDPWPGAGTFTTTDTTDPGGSVTTNSSVDDNGLGTDSTVVYSGPLTNFPVEATADAVGTWMVNLTVSGLPSEWNSGTGTVTTLTSGIITVNGTTCGADIDCPPDGNVCTDAVCNLSTGMCESQNNTSPCSNGNACTTGDTCSGGSCVAGPPLICNDGNTCTIDTCNPASGCVFTNNAAPCDDGDACTQNDTCAGGMCVSGAPIMCNDFNVCTDDTCNSVSGCVFTNNALACDDLVFCNGADSCLSGSCAVHTGDPCTGGGECADLCDESGNTCNLPAGTACTSDGNPCTDNVCDGAGNCAASNNLASCDDGMACTNPDTCAGGACVGGPTLPGCVNCTVPMDCNDGDVCTTDNCVLGECQFTPSGTCPFTLTLDRGATVCYEESPDNPANPAGTTVTVNIDLATMPGNTAQIIGGQFYLEYDPIRLIFVSIEPEGAVFNTEIIEVVDTIAGTIDYAVSAGSFGCAGTTGSSTMAVLTFVTSNASECVPFVRFRNHTPPTSLAECGNPVSHIPARMDMLPIRIDETAPAIMSPQSNLIVSAEVGGCTANVGWTPMLASDTCDGTLPVNCTFVDAGSATVVGDTGLFPFGTTSVDCSVTDTCGNTSTHAFTTTVDPNELIVNVELANVNPGPFTRCITFEIFDCDGAAVPVEVKQEITFTNGLATDVSVPVPCGMGIVYDCITARDALHTLRRTTTVTNDGITYSANFTGAGKRLIGGNLNDDPFIDIGDFAVFSAQFSFIAQGGPNTDCTTVYPNLHPDIDGDAAGIVGTADFTFIRQNFGRTHDANCCGLPLPIMPAGRIGPRRSISVRELIATGQGHLSVADLNGDGWVNMKDMEAFMTGETPAGGSRAGSFRLDQN